KPTNYSLLTYRKSINDLPSYSRLIAVHQEKHSSEVNHYLAFYQALEKIKSGHGKENGNLKKAFKQHDDSLMKADLPIDTPLQDILVSIGNGTLAQSAVKPKEPKAAKAQKFHSSYLLAGEKASIIFTVLSLLVATASAIVFKPELAFVVIFVLAIVAAIMSRCGDGHMCLNEKNPYKGLLIASGVFSVALFYSVFYLSFLASGSMAAFDMVDLEDESILTPIVGGLVFGGVFAVINCIVTLVRKCKRSSLDVDNSNAFVYYSLTMMAILAAAVAGFNLSITLVGFSTIFGIPVDITSGIWPVFINATPYVLPVVTAIVLRLIRGEGY
ncbi:MAG: hypothetical protein J5627_03150, partial [Bacilli bacterium]|nr:hypothetical protein [Bacilli bacterium]